MPRDERGVRALVAGQNTPDKRYIIRVRYV